MPFFDFLKNDEMQKKIRNLKLLKTLKLSLLYLASPWIQNILIEVTRIMKSSVLKLTFFLSLVISVLLAIPLLISTANAREIRELYNGVRPLGMGNAFVAISDDYNALFYNPAGLEFLDSGTFSFFIRGEASAKTKDIIDAVDSGQSETEISNAISKLSGKRGVIGADVNISYVKSGFAIALMPVNAQISYDIHTAGPLPTVDARAIADSHIMGAWSHSYYDNRLKIGVAPRFTYRVSLEDSLTPIGIKAGALDLDNFGEGYGVDANVGLIYHPPWFQSKIKPTLGLVFKNIIASRFQNTFHLINDGRKRPEANHRKADLGIAVRPVEKWGPLSVTMAFDVKNIGARQDDDRFTKHFHYGTEVKTEFTSWLGGALRAGMNQTALWTAGLSAYLGPVTVDLASYAEELGGYPSQRPDRRYSAQAGFVF